MLQDAFLRLLEVGLLGAGIVHGEVALGDPVVQAWEDGLALRVELVGLS